jgi:hypothetical protein
MIKTLKIFAIAILATGATVASTRAAATTYADTNALQAVTVKLTVYADKASAPTNLVTGAGASFTTADLLTVVTNAMTNKFSKKATLDLVTLETTTSTEVTTNISSIVTNVVTNTVSSPASLVISSNNELIGGVAITNSGTGANVTNDLGTTNVTIGDTSGGNYVTITANDGTTNIIVTTEGGTGPVSVAVATNTVSLTGDTATTGSTSATVAASAALGASTVPVETANVTIETNGVIVTNIAIGTNTFTIATNSLGTGTNVVTVTVGTTSVSVTNTAAVTNLVLIGTNVIDTNAVISGFGTNSSLTSSLTTTFTLLTSTAVATNASGVTTNTTITTNVAVVTETTAYTTSAVIKTNYVTNFESVTITNAGGPAQFTIVDVVSNVPVYAVVPAGILTITNVTDNEIAADSGKKVADYALENLILEAADASGTNYLKLQGVVQNTVQDVAVKSAPGGTIVVTNSAWTDVSGWGTFDGAPVIVEGTVTIAAPTTEKVPK